MSQAEVRIETTDLRRSFGTRVAVDGVTLRVLSGEIYGLVGPDGAGKTTTLRMLAGLLEPSSGHVVLVGLDPFGSSPELREALGYMPQQYSLYGDLTVAENLAFFGEMFCLSRKAFLRRRERLLAITRLSEFRERRAEALSGGMYKKLALACALLHEPKVLFLDEPTNGVDPVSRREFWELLRDFLSEGMAIALATPYMDEAARCHRAGLLFEGRLLEEGYPSEMVRAFPHSVLRVRGERSKVVAAIEKDTGVLAFTPAGAELRIVVRRDRGKAVLLLLSGLGAQWTHATASFEDLFLTRAHEQGVDPEARRNFWRLIRRLADEGTTVFVTTHYMDEAEYCDRVGLMVAGELAALDTPDRLKQTFVPGRMYEVHGAGALAVRNAASGLNVLDVEPFGAALHVRVAENGPDPETLGRELGRRGVRISSIGAAEVTLEDVFLRVVGSATGAKGSTREQGSQP